MRKNIPFKWELLHTSFVPNMGGSNTNRVKVIGGWILSSEVYLISSSHSQNVSNSICFIADRDHEWTIEEQPSDEFEEDKFEENVKLNEFDPRN